MIAQLPKKNGTPCSPEDSVESAPCNVFECGTLQICEWSPWSALSQCSTTCGEGYKVKVRTLVHTAQSAENEESLDTDAVLASGVMNEIDNVQVKYQTTSSKNG